MRHKNITLYKPSTSVTENEMHTKSTNVHNATSNDSCIVKLKWQKYMTTAPKVNDIY